MNPILTLIEIGGRCPTCGRGDVRPMRSIINNCDTSLFALANGSAGGTAAAILAAQTLKSTASDLRCCMGLCKHLTPP
jgi:hypothetical protein